MYKNYGDKNFFDMGILLDDEHSDTVFPVILCRPYPDEENKFQFAMGEVDVTDSWIDRKGVMSYAGMTEETYNAAQFAVDCTNYYDWENFGQVWREANREQIESALRMEEIASDNLDMPWIDDFPTWFKTDDDQWCKKLEDRKYQFIQYEDTFDALGFDSVYEATVDLDDYSEEDIDEIVSTYYDKGVNDIPEDGKEQIIAECIFESLQMHDIDSSIEVSSREEGIKRIDQFIWCRETVLM